MSVSFTAAVCAPAEVGVTAASPVRVAGAVSPPSAVKTPAVAPAHASRTAAIQPPCRAEETGLRRARDGYCRDVLN